MTFTDAAAEVLRLVGRPLHYKEITDIAIEKNLLSHVGKSPEVTMGARLAATLKKDSSDNPLVRVKPGVFALREWDDKTIKSGLEPKKAARKGRSHADDAEAPGPSAGARVADDDDEVLIGSDDAEEAHADEDAAADAVSGAGAGEEAPAPTPRPASVDGAEPAERSRPRAPVEYPVASSFPSAVLRVAEPTAAVPYAARPVAPAAPAAAAPSGAPEDEAEEIFVEPGPDDAMRAEAAAGAAEMFDEEEDDDQPILGGGDDRAPQPGAGEQGDGRGRRRRRRRRGRTNGETPAAGGLPSYTATPAFDAPRDTPRDNRDAPRESRDNRDNRDAPRDNRDAPRDNRRERESSAGREPAGGEPVFRPQVIELTAGEGHMLDDLAGRELSDAVAAILSTFDRNAGAVSLRQIAETAQRRGRLAGDAQLVQSQVAAAVRADNARRLTSGQRPRFRLAGGRVALTDWLLSGDLARLEQEALAAVERYREAARRAFVRKLIELPGHAFVEICVLALEKMGVSQLRALRRAGVPGGESHFSGVFHASRGPLDPRGQGSPVDELRLALVIRRDGREVGRERVADLRGSLHHYGPATAGWIFTAGQMLSGAREEASVPGVAPIALFDGLAIARLCEDNDVAVIRARLPIAIPDVDLLEALRAS
jgi:hypothetical protein